MAEVLIVAGEPSGDAIGAELVDAARKMEPSICFFGATGPALEAAGAKRVVATRELTTMGLTEVLPRLPGIRRAMKRLERAAADHRTIGAVLIDSPDFNLRLARKLDRRSIPVVQYVSPSVWGWRPGRVSAIEKSVRRVLLTLPFEAEFYRDSCVDAVYVGHPALDRIPADVGDRQAVAARLGLNASRRWIALLPGSRSGELDRMGPLLAESATRIRQRIPDIELVTMVAPGLDPSAVASALAGVSGLGDTRRSTRRRLPSFPHHVRDRQAHGSGTLDRATQSDRRSSDRSRVHSTRRGAAPTGATGDRVVGRRPRGGNDQGGAAKRVSDPRSGGRRRTRGQSCAIRLWHPRRVITAAQHNRLTCIEGVAIIR